MTGRALYRTQVILVLAPLAAILTCSIHGLYFAATLIYSCVDIAIIALSTLAIAYADNLAVVLCEFVTRMRSPERAPTALE